MSLFGRIIVIFFALIVAIVAAGVVLAIGIVAPESSLRERLALPNLRATQTSLLFVSIAYRLGGAPCN